MPERFSASNAGKHMACHASANLDLAIPNWTPPVRDPNADNAANRGSDMHDILEQVTNLPAKDMKMMAAAIDYVADLRSTRRFKVLTEVEVTATWLSTQPTTKVDVVLHTQDEIHVIDWKTGKIHVDVHDNKQLMFYAVCFAPLAPKAKGVTVHIVQPWANNIEAVFIPTLELKQFMDEATAAHDAIVGGSTTFNVSDDCKFCPAFPHSRGEKGKPLCPAAMQLLYPSPLDEDAILDL